MVWRSLITIGCMLGIGLALKADEHHEHLQVAAQPSEQFSRDEVSDDLDELNALLDDDSRPIPTAQNSALVRYTPVWVKRLAIAVLQNICICASSGSFIGSNPMNDTPHLFALYHASLPVVSSGDLFLLEDPRLIHRMQAVLRLSCGDRCILFDETLHLNVCIAKISRKSIEVVIEAVHVSQKLKPDITVFLGLLKPEAFEQALYNAVELGAIAVQPVITAKSHMQRMHGRQQERYAHIIQAAAEQAKNFALPLLMPAVSFQETIQLLDARHDTVLFFDPAGVPAHEVIGAVHRTASFACIIGPEGDLTVDEKAVLQHHGAHFCALTPTILRAPQALTVALGMMRTMLKAS